MVIGVHAPAGKDHDIRHEAMPCVALAHQQLWAFAALPPDNQAGRITRARSTGARAALAFNIGAAGIIGGGVFAARAFSQA